jgi:Uncharacterised protein conserved in bacteria (DUF2336)
MTDAKERLPRLIELAGETTPEKLRALAFELSDLLTDWPAHYPTEMREPFEALLEKVLKRLDGTSRQMIAARLARDSGTAVTLLNEFYFDVPAEERAAILARNAEGDHAPDTTVEGADEVRLIAAARNTRGRDFAAAFASFLGVPVSTAERILEDASGNALTVACKGANVRRATYSALALLTVCELRINPGARFMHLQAYDAIPAGGARRLLDHWRTQVEETQATAEDARAA